MWRTLALTGVVVMSVTASGSQKPMLNTVMREKLAHTQEILAAVVTSDWASLETHTRALEELTNDPRWMVLNYPEYSRHSAAFVQAVRALHTAAAQRASTRRRRRMCPSRCNVSTVTGIWRARASLVD
jgi:hypothetical protein